MKFCKDEGDRFRLGSFKALGGAYAALCLLQKQISFTFLYESAKANEVKRVKIKEETIMAGLSCGEVSEIA